MVLEGSVHVPATATYASLYVPNLAFSHDASSRKRCVTWSRSESQVWSPFVHILLLRCTVLYLILLSAPWKGRHPCLGYRFWRGHPTRRQAQSRNGFCELSLVQCVCLHPEPLKCQGLNKDIYLRQLQQCMLQTCNKTYASNNVVSCILHSHQSSKLAP